MTKAIRIDHLNKKILISKSFAKMAMNANSSEYKDLSEIRKEHPDYKIVERVIKKNTSKETYRGLTYEYMRDFIIAQYDPQKTSDAIAEFEEVLLISKCHRKSYPIVKKWFLSKYPKVDMIEERANTVEIDVENKEVA